MAPHRPLPWWRPTAGTVLLAALALAGAEAAAQKPEERFTPAPAPTVSLPRLTPLDGARAEGLAPTTALRPPPAVAPLLAPLRAPPAPLPAPSPGPSPTAPPPPPPPPDPKPAPVPPPPAANAPTVPVVTTAGVYLRAAPGTDARALDTVEPGERLEAFGPAVDGWRRVGRKGKPLGYVAAAHLAEVRPGSATPVPGGRYAKADRDDRGCALPDDLPGNRRALPAGSVARVLADANLRVAPACDARVEDVLEDGERVTILDAAGSWYRVGRKGKPLGYVGAALLAPVKPR